MIGVIGLGFVGLTTSLGFAHKGFKVYGFDISLEKNKKLNKGNIPFYEPYLYEQLKKHKDNNFFICKTLEDVIKKSNIIFYCVGTPSKINGESDLNNLKDAIKKSLDYINKYKILVIKSTIPPSTTKEIIEPLIRKSNKEIGLANNPEFLREGYAWKDFIYPDRIVIGENDKKSGDNVEKIYKSFNAPIFRVSLNTAEFIKYLSNTMLATMISFSNELSMIADTFGDIDISKSFKILHLDKRWNGSPAKMASYIYPGCGFGGYCLPKDTIAIYNKSKNAGYDPQLIKEVLSVNKKVKNFIVNKITETTNKEDYICILGLSFKPESDDVRDTPSKDIIKMLVENGYNNIIAYDPIAKENFKNTYNFPISYSNNLEDTISKCSTIVILTAWNEFKKINFKNKKIIDGRYFL